MRKSKLLNFGEGGMPLESQNPPEFKFPWKTALFLAGIVVVTFILMYHPSHEDDGKQVS